MFRQILKGQIAQKKNRKKGFTLIEVIVVIVILAILAAIAVPSLTGYINKAGTRAAQATAHNIQVVLQAALTDNYQYESVTKSSIASSDVIFTTASPGTDKTAEAVLTAEGITLPTTPATPLSAISIDKSKLTGFTYEDSKATVVYLNGTFTTTPK